MLFNSATFLIFFAVVYPAYLATRRHLRLQNAVLLLASYVFYGWWSLQFLGLLLLTTLFDWTIGRLLGRLTEPDGRRALVTASICVNLGLLGFFSNHTSNAAVANTTTTRSAPAPRRFPGGMAARADSIVRFPSRPRPR